MTAFVNGFSTTGAVVRVVPVYIASINSCARVLQLYKIPVVLDYKLST